MGTWMVRSLSVGGACGMSIEKLRGDGHMTYSVFFLTAGEVDSLSTGSFRPQARDPLSANTFTNRLAAAATRFNEMVLRSRAWDFS